MDQLPPSLEDRRKRILRTRKVRGFCYAMKSGTADLSDPELQELALVIEELPHFGGWELFAVTWDLDRDKMLADLDYLEITPLDFSLEEQWQAEVRRAAIDLPKRNAPLGLR